MEALSISFDEYMDKIGDEDLVDFSDPIPHIDGEDIPAYEDFVSHGNIFEMK